ncbi:hypothetical protein P9112_000316 [Eukaryota sp. TZLM1-RC]
MFNKDNKWSPVLLLYILTIAVHTGLSYVISRWVLFAVFSQVAPFARELFWDSSLQLIVLLSYGIYAIPHILSAMIVLRLTVFYAGHTALILLLLALTQTVVFTTLALLYRRWFRLDLRIPTVRDVLIYLFAILITPSLMLCSSIYSYFRYSANVLVLIIVGAELGLFLPTLLDWMTLAIIAYVLLGPVFASVLVIIFDHLLVKTALCFMIPQHYRHCHGTISCFICNRPQLPLLVWPLLLVNMAYVGLLVWISVIGPELSYFVLLFVPFSFYFIYHGYYAAVFWGLSVFVGVLIFVALFVIIPTPGVSLVFTGVSAATIILLSAILSDDIKRERLRSAALLEAAVQKRTEELVCARDELQESISVRNQFLIDIYQSTKDIYEETKSSMVELSQVPCSPQEQTYVRDAMTAAGQLEWFLEDLKLVTELEDASLVEKQEPVCFYTVFDVVASRISHCNIHCIHLYDLLPNVHVPLIGTNKYLFEKMLFILLRMYFSFTSERDLSVMLISYREHYLHTTSPFERRETLTQGRIVVPHDASICILMELKDSQLFHEKIEEMLALHTEQQYFFVSYLLLLKVCELLNTELFITTTGNIVLRGFYPVQDIGDYSSLAKTVSSKFPTAKVITNNFLLRKHLLSILETSGITVDHSPHCPPVSLVIIDEASVDPLEYEDFPDTVLETNKVLFCGSDVRLNKIKHPIYLAKLLHFISQDSRPLLNPDIYVLYGSIVQRTLLSFLLRKYKVNVLLRNNTEEICQEIVNKFEKGDNLPLFFIFDDPCCPSGTSAESVRYFATSFDVNHAPVIVAIDPLAPSNNFNHSMKQVMNGRVMDSLLIQSHTFFDR